MNCVSEPFLVDRKVQVQRFVFFDLIDGHATGPATYCLWRSFIRVSYLPLYAARVCCLISIDDRLLIVHWPLVRMRWTVDCSSVCSVVGSLSAERSTSTRALIHCPAKFCCLAFYYYPADLVFIDTVHRLNFDGRIEVGLNLTAFMVEFRYDCNTK